MLGSLEDRRKPEQWGSRRSGGGGLAGARLHGPWSIECGSRGGMGTAKAGVKVEAGVTQLWSSTRWWGRERGGERGGEI